MSVDFFVLKKKFMLKKMLIFGKYLVVFLLTPRPSSSLVLLSSLPGWEPMLGFQLENLLLKNRPLLYQALGIYVQDVVIDNPYFQKASGRKKGCQIDYLIQMRSNIFFVCEVKMRRRELGLEVIDAMKTKIACLKLPKGFGISPVLFHLGPVSDALLSSRYFYRIVDIADL